MKIKIVFILLFLFIISCSNDNDRKKILIDTDCGTDDIIAVELLLARENIEITGISCVHGLTEVMDGAKIMRCLLDRYGHKETPVFFGANQAIIPSGTFPDGVKKHITSTGFKLAGENCDGKIENFNPDRILKIIERSTEILALGPLTNISNLIENGLDKDVRTVIMGGAINVGGNVNDTEEFQSDNIYAEWNFFCDPLAAKNCIEYLDNIVLVPLDATNSVKIDSTYLNESNWKGRSSSISFKIIQEIKNWIQRGQYYAWDPLTAAYIIDPGVLEIDSANVRVISDGNEAGRIIRDLNGKKIIYGVSGNKKKFEDLLMSAL
jgi:purine nucleosidase